MTSPKTVRKSEILKIWKNYHNSGQFPTGTILCQASKQVKPEDDKIGE